jgi:MinD-like ATPase involved in chromosome partitioning or flagellar assembly
MGTQPHNGHAGVLLAAEGRSWEPDALSALSLAEGLVTLRRCLDLHDLLAVATTGTAQVAVVAHGVGVDRDLVDRLAAHGVQVVAVLPDHDTRAAGREDEVARLVDIGVVAVVAESEVPGRLVPQVRDAVAGRAETPDQQDATAWTSPGEVRRGRVLAVWGATGAPGRTTVTVGLAAALARNGRPTLLVDADPFGGSVAQHLGILDEASGLLGAIRHANAGALTPERVRAAARSADEHLDVLTGLPRPDRWREVRARNLVEVLTCAAETAEHVVVDAGFGAEVAAPVGTPAPRSREALVTSVLQEADDLVVVGSAEPVGLTRMARLLVDCRQVRQEGPSHVVVNRMRSGLGWRESEIADMVFRLCPGAKVHFVPFDLDGADRAMQAGRSVVENGSSPLADSLLRLGAAVLGTPVTGQRRGGRPAWLAVRR